MAAAVDGFVNGRIIVLPDHMAGPSVARDSESTVRSAGTDAADRPPSSALLPDAVDPEQVAGEVDRLHRAAVDVDRFTGNARYFRGGERASTRSPLLRGSAMNRCWAI
jgi:hypothetical protein